MLQKLAVFGLCLAALAPGSALAGAAQAPAARPSLNLESLKSALESGDEARVSSALDQIETAADGRAATLVDAFLQRGANATLLLRALAVAGTLGRESSSGVVAPYVKHRSAEVRRAAARSLAQTKGNVAVQALREALRSNDPSLRGVAAEGLGALGAKASVPDLFVVLPREVPEAAAAIGSLCSADECSRFVALLGKLPFEVMQSGFLPLLLRTGTDVPAPVKLNLIERLRRMATPKASALLSTALAAYPEHGDAQIRTALDAALHGHAVTGGAS